LNDILEETSNPGSPSKQSSSNDSPSLSSPQLAAFTKEEKEIATYRC